MCHNTWATDEGRRPGVDPVANPPETVDFKVMIHKIHRGVDLANDYTVFGFGGSEHNYNELVFPGALNDCNFCHIDDSHLLPGAPDRATTVINVAGVPVPEGAVQTPTTAACTSCHDDDDAVTHAQLNSIVVDPLTWSESCNVCHGEGSSVAVSEVHTTE
jgi:OmcA/MtrC family decaheme c-type cytochrome